MNEPLPFFEDIDASWHADNLRNGSLWHLKYEGKKLDYGENGEMYFWSFCDRKGWRLLFLEDEANPPGWDWKDRMIGNCYIIRIERCEDCAGLGLTARCAHISQVLYCTTTKEFCT